MDNRAALTSEGDSRGMTVVLIVVGVLVILAA